MLYCLVYVYNQIDLKKEKFLTKHTLWYKTFLEIYIKNANLRLKNTIIKKLTYESENWILTNRDRKLMNIFEREMYGRILGPVYDSVKEYRRISTDKNI
jgi:hypothetical protein